MLQGVVGLSRSGREIYGYPGTKYAAFVGMFNLMPNVWAGGEVTMPYWTDHRASRFLTDEELERVYPELLSRDLTSRETGRITGA